MMTTLPLFPSNGEEDNEVKLSLTKKMKSRICLILFNVLIKPYRHLMAQSNT